MQVKSVSPQILFKLGMCVLALALVALAGLLPQQDRIDGLHRDIAGAQADVRRQNALMPMYSKLRAQVKQGLPEAIPPLREVRLKLDNITDIQGILTDMAKARGVFPEGITPDPSSLASGGKALSVNCIFHGRLDALRGLLLDLGTLSSLRHVEKVSIREEGIEAVMQLKAWMTLE